MNVCAKVPTIDVSPNSTQPNQLVTLQELAIAIRTAIHTYPHYIVVNGFPAHQVPEYLRTLARGIGAAMESTSDTESISDSALLAEDTVSFTKVTIRPEKITPGGDATRYSRTHQPLQPHTDSSYRPIPHELVAFQVIVADEKGGETVMAPVEDVLKRLDDQVIARLREPVYPFSQGHYAILSGTGAHIQIRYYRTQLDHTLDLQGLTLAPEYLEAIQYLDTALSEIAPVHQFAVKPGQILFMHNHKVLHGRTGLSNESDRLLYRIRLHLDCLATVPPTIPAAVEAHLDLAEDLEFVGRLRAAMPYYRRASELAPDDIAVLNAYGDFLLYQGQFSEAIGVFRRALELDPNDYDSGLAMSSLMHKLGDTATAKTIMHHVARQHPYHVDPDAAPNQANILRLRGFEGAEYSILQQANGNYKQLLRGGHFSIGHLLPDDTYNLHLLNILGNNTDDLTVPQFDLMLNTIACPDSQRSSLLAAAQFVDRYPDIPIINHPRQVLETTRERNSIRLNTIPDVLFPKTEKLWWDGQSLEQITRDIAGLGFRFPMIVREVGSQTGQSVGLVHDQAELHHYFETTSTAQAYYVIQFHDCGLPQNVFRKMRFFCIDGQIYPIANVFHNAWNIHSGDRYAIMQQNSWMQAEEKKFLKNPSTYIGHDNFQRLYEIRDLIGLDFFGIDCTILQDGTIFIFELNPAMRHNFDHAGNFPYTRPHLETASNAFNQMVQSRLNHS